MSHSLLPRIAVSLVLVALVAFGGAEVRRRLAAKSAGPVQQQSTMALPSASAVRLTRAPYRETIRGFCTARSLQRTIVAAEVSGRVTFVEPRLEAGAKVSKGLEVVRIDPGDLSEALAQARARAVQTQAIIDQAMAAIKTAEEQRTVALRELGLAKDQLGRLERGAVEDAVTPFDLDTQRIAVAARERLVAQFDGQIATTSAEIGRWQAELAAGRSAERRAQRDVDRTTIAVPFDGVIEARDVESGGWVAVGSPLFTLVEPDRLEVGIAIPASQRVDVALGSAVILRHPGRTETLAASTITRIAPFIDERDRTFLAYTVIEGALARPGLAPGSFLEASIEGRSHEDVLVVPRRALIERRVFVVERSAPGSEIAIVRTRAPVIVRELPDVVLVTTGLESGDEIVEGNVEQMADGAKIRLTERVGASGATQR